MLKQLISLFVVLLMAVVTFVWIESYSPSFQECIGEHVAKSANEDSTELIVDLIRSYVGCTEMLANKYNALITALPTVLLAAITFGLILSGVDQQSTIRAQLRAYVMIDTVQLINVCF